MMAFSPDRFTLTGGTGHQHMRHLAQINHENLIGNRLTQSYRQVISRLLELLATDDTLSETIFGFEFGTSIPIVPFPGIGAMIRIPNAERLRAISSSKPRILEIRTLARG